MDLAAPPNPVWRGPSPCTTPVTELDAIAATAAQIDGDVRRRLADATTVFHDLVAWAYVYDTERSHALLVRHRRLRRWMPPGGLVEAGETPLEAAVRELREETGVEAHPSADQRAALVDVVDHALPDGSAASSFGVAYVFVTDMASALQPEPAQPAAWCSLSTPPTQVAERHWQRLLHHVPGR